MPRTPENAGLSLLELRELRAAGEAIVTPEVAAPWLLMKCSRATWYRAAKAGEFDAFVRPLGRSYRLLIGAFLQWLDADTPTP